MAFTNLAACGVGSYSGSMNTCSPLARKPGRPSRLSREHIISATIEMLDGGRIAEFSIGKLAKKLGVAPMALYRYFPGRDALLDAVAEHIFMQIDLPDASGRWQDFVLSWLRVLTMHFQRHPIALEVIAWDEHLSAGWLRVWLQLVRVLAKEEPDDERMAYILGWFSRTSIGFIQAYVVGPRRLAGLPDDVLAAFPAPERDLLQRIHAHHVAPHDDAIEDFAFRHIIGGLELLLAGKDSDPLAARA